jgi:hypothetical protein
MSDEQLTLIHSFRYPLASHQRLNDNEHMARLNYMASRIRAALCEWLKDPMKMEGSELWWWRGLKIEEVTYKIYLEMIDFILNE